MMKTTLCKHALIAATATAILLVVTGGIASAHIEPDPIAMQVGTSDTVAFNVEDGCDGSPVTEVKIQIPAGVTGVAAVDKPGWTATVAGDTVGFKGGPLDAATEDHFDITLTAPATAGDIHFPAIEFCEVGEIDWIEIPSEGAPEPENVAPTIKITQDPPTAAQLAPAPEEPEATSDTATTASGGTIDIGATTDTLLVTTAITVAPDDDSSDTGTIVVVIVVVAILLVGGGVMVARRKGAAPKA